jgi:hypothetical protein
MGIIGDLVGVAKDLWELRSSFANAKQEQRDRISDYFLSISDCLHATHESLAQGVYPHQRCAELKGYADLLADTLKGTINKTKADELATRLRGAHEVERLHAELRSDPKAREELPMLAEAAGTLAALGKSVRAGLSL